MLVALFKSNDFSATRAIYLQLIAMRLLQLTQSMQLPWLFSARRTPIRLVFIFVFLLIFLRAWQTEKVLAVLALLQCVPQLVAHRALEVAVLYVFSFFKILFDNKLFYAQFCFFCHDLLQKLLFI